MRSGIARVALTAAGALLASAALFAQPAAVVAPSGAVSAPPAPHDAAGEVSLERILRHPEWIGRGPTQSLWGADSRTDFWRRPTALRDGVDLRESETLESDLTGEVLRILGPQEESRVPFPFGAALDRERRRRLETRDGDLFLVDLATGDARQLTATATAERGAPFLDDGRIAFLRDGQVFARDLESGLESQLFDVRFEQDPEEKLAEERKEADFLRRQQARYFDWIRAEDAREQRRLERSAEEHADPARPPKPFYLGDKRESGSLWPSPDAQVLVLSVAPKQRNRGKRDEMPSYVTGSGWVETSAVRPKVGTGDGDGETLLLLDRRTHEVVEIDLSSLPNILDDPLAELRAKAEASRKAELAALQWIEDGSEDGPEDRPEEPETTADEGGAEKPAQAGKNGKPKPRAVRLDRARWSADRQTAVLQAFSIDNKDRWIFALDVAERSVRPLYHRHDPAWINRRFGDLDFLPGDQMLYLLSEESGWSQLYLLDPATPESLQRLTNGDFVVDSPTPSPDGRFLYYTANPEHPGRYDVFRVRLPERAVERVTELGGLTSFELSPDGQKLLVTHSTTTRPPELFVQDAAPGAEPRRITAEVSAEFTAVDWVAPQVVEVPSSHHDRPIYSRIYLPTKAAPGVRGGRRPAVVFVHGAGYLQDAHLGWSSYFREFMFHTLLAREGYVVLDMDYRGSAGYGRDWRTAIYRNMGWPEVEDLADGVAYLAAEHGVDPARVGVYGGSYGGFLTMMSLFNRPDLFAAGAALRPVTDWAHYNQGYTSNILNTPDIDPEAYARSSPIEYAPGLEKPLLIATGMLDDNVLFQDSVRLVQRLIELEKRDWWIAIYPVEPHGFREPSSWLDEYRRIHDLFERYLE